MTGEGGLIAPCGMNCGICLAHLRTRNRCDGCRSNATAKAAYRGTCVIRNCDTVNSNESGFCFECPKYPCRRLRQLDKRYRTRYGMSMLENLEFIRDHGLAAFVEKETERWRCPRCGGTMCVHRSRCLACGEPRAVAG